MALNFDHDIVQGLPALQSQLYIIRGLYMQITIDRCKFSYLPRWIPGIHFANNLLFSPQRLYGLKTWSKYTMASFYHRHHTRWIALWSTYWFFQNSLDYNVAEIKLRLVFCVCLFYDLLLIIYDKILVWKYMRIYSPHCPPVRFSLLGMIMRLH